MIALTAQAAMLGLATFSMADADVPKNTVLAQATQSPVISTMGRSNDDLMTTPQGCTYRKTQAPGYPPRWILIVNPQMLGKQLPAGKCKGML